MSDKSPVKSSPVPTTKKGQEALDMRMRDMKLKDLPAIGEATEKALVEAGVTTPYRLLIEYLERGSEGFEKWLSETCKGMKEDLKQDLITVLEAKAARVELI